MSWTEHAFRTLFALQRRWYTTTLPWWVWAAGVLLALGAGGVLSQALVQALAERQRADDALAALRATPWPSAQKALQPPDFALQLPAQLDHVEWARSLNAHAAGQNVLIRRITVRMQDATQETLARQVFEVALRGQYPGVKAVLKAQLDAYPETAITRISLQRATGAAEVDGVVVLTRFGQPAQADVAQAAATPARAEPGSGPGAVR
ncbi:hypothetical protein IP84_07025 [beta proteobacterium AAP99]|nr:hypothetical protein IP84_07025 [beta proteobacterium AAP99]